MRQKSTEESVGPLFGRRDLLRAAAACETPSWRRLAAKETNWNSSVDDIDPCAEDIPRAALGTDVARFRRIALQLAAQPQDLRIN
jgi:hypothetical protein